MQYNFPWFFFSSRRRHTRCLSDGSSDVCSSDLIGVQRGTRLDVGLHFCLKRFLFAVSDNLRLDLTMNPIAFCPLKHSEHGGFIGWACSGDAPFPNVHVHVAGLASNERLINFAFATEFQDGTILQGVADSVIHKPCGLLRDFERTVNLPTADAILAVDHHPHCGKPFVQPKRRVLEDRASLERELRGVVFLATVPAVIVLQEQDVLAATTRADDAVRPATGY